MERFFIGCQSERPQPLKGTECKTEAQTPETNKEVVEYIAGLFKALSIIRSAK
jgi:hypothetical protein